VLFSSHIGIKRNELADRLVNAGAVMSNIDVIYWFRIV